MLRTLRQDYVCILETLIEKDHLLQKWAMFESFLELQSTALGLISSNHIEPKGL